MKSKIVYKFNIFIQSKHKTYLIRFINLFNSKSKIHLKSIKHYLQKKNSSSSFSVLTSPHVNKRAQEQFKTNVVKLQLKIKTLEPLKFIILLKQLYSQSLPNLRMKIRTTVDKKMKKNRVRCTGPLKIGVQKQNFYKRKVLKILDSYGN